MGWTLQGSKVVGSGPQVRAETDAYVHHTRDISLYLSGVQSCLVQNQNVNVNA